MLNLNRNRERGQTLVIAMIVLGVLLILGFVFLGIINHNIQSSSRSQNRTIASDLAEAGARYAHSELLQSPLGADWKPAPTPPAAVSGQPDVSRDPDLFYLRPGTGLPFRTATDTIKDLGGPDGLGPFTRLSYANGRSLLRVRYGPSDANIFSSTPTGPERNPGILRNYLQIESVGRQGVVNTSDPTTLSSATGVQFQNFANSNAMRDALGLMRQAEAKFPHSRRITALVSLGNIESARFITNKYRVSRPAEIGIPAEMGATYGSAIVVGLNLPYQIGYSGQSPNSGGLGDTPQGGGSMQINADVKLVGTIRAFVNQFLGDSWSISGSVTADPAAQVLVYKSSFDRTTGNWIYPNLATPDQLTAANLNSRSDTYATDGGVIRDGYGGTDLAGYARGVGYKVPPSIELADPETGENRYVLMTRESGPVLNGSNVGAYGYGEGIYVNNFSDRQSGKDEVARSKTEDSLVTDWLNPNNSQSTYWKGPFYTPRGSYVLFTSDGVTVYRDNLAPPAELFWRNRDGSSSGSSVMRYRFGLVNGKVYVINNLTPGANINSPNPNFAAGEVFNGVLYFEGNVRVRGVIPTDVQISLISNATIYIEGSITKGLVNNFVTGGAYGTRLTRPTKSSLFLGAHDYVAVNTSQFFGPSPTSVVEEVNDVPAGTAYNPVRVKAAGGTIGLQDDFILDPFTGTPFNPSTWHVYNQDYIDSANPGTKLVTQMMLTHTQDNGLGGSAAFISMDVNYGLNNSTYYFPPSDANTATGYLGNAGNIAMYGLGNEPYQRYERFEGTSFPIIDPNTATFSNLSPYVIKANGLGSPDNAYSLMQQDLNQLLIKTTSLGGLPTNDYLIARHAIVPADIRIEAAIMAEEGSFFVIPAPWFNNNPNDRRDIYDNEVTTFKASGLSDDEARAKADAERLDNRGMSPQVPFFGEPIDVRVVILGSITENMPPPMSIQSEWLKKWAWIPKALGATKSGIPTSHVPPGYDPTIPYVPNLIVAYDPMLATARTQGFVTDNDPTSYVRTGWYDFNGDGVQQAWEFVPLPPMPRLPVSPALSYFGEVE